MSFTSILRRGPLRFVVLIGFIVLAAALARLAELATGWILAVIAIAWALAALIERSAHRAAQATIATPEAAAAMFAPVAFDPVAAPRVTPAATVRPRPAVRYQDDLWLEDDAEIDPAPAPAVPWSEPPPVVRAASADKPEPEPAYEPTPEPAPEPTPEPELVLPPPARPPSSSSLPRGIWNLWELEGIARENAGVDASHDEERSLILMYLREFASAEGILGPEFDDLVRETFGELLPSR